MKKTAMTPFRCKFCPINFYSFDRWKTHLWKHLMKYVYAYKAKKCLYSYRGLSEKNCFQSRFGIHNMFLLEHSSFLDTSEYSSDVLPITNEKPYRCKHCQKCFEDSDELTHHMKTHMCKYSIKTTFTHSKSELMTQQNKQEISEKACQCKHCQKTYKQGTTENAGCKYFGQHGNIKPHIKAHAEVKQYQCEYCQKCFAHNWRLKRHIRMHTKEKPYQCEYCQKCFVHNWRLKRHIRMHTKEKPYQCEYCQKMFYT